MDKMAIYEWPFLQRRCPSGRQARVEVFHFIRYQGKQATTTTAPRVTPTATAETKETDSEK